jgi:hypothetical protein
LTLHNLCDIMLKVIQNYIFMSQNKLTTFIHNNLIATIIAALIVGGGLSTLAFTAYNSGTKSVQNNVTGTTASPLSSSSIIKSSSIVSSSSAQEIKKETVKETPKSFEVEKPKVVEEVKPAKVTDPVLKKNNTPIEVYNLELTNVRVGGIDPQGKLTYSDSIGRIILFGTQEPYYPSSTLNSKAIYSGLLIPRIDIGELVFEPSKGYLKDIIEPIIPDFSSPRTDANNGRTEFTTNATIPLENTFVSLFRKPSYEGALFYDLKTENNIIIRVFSDNYSEIANDKIGKKYILSGTIEYSTYFNSDNLYKVYNEKPQGDVYVPLNDQKLLIKAQ